MRRNTIITKVFIPNRGECAVRLLDTLRKLGIPAVVAYTPEDKNCYHVKMADEAIEISSYNDIPGIIKAARRCGADAILPGWGFRSEDPKFAKACEKEGIIFIGPPEDAMKICGRKESTKNLAKKAGVPTIPGTPQSMQKGRLKRWAIKHGLSNEEDSVCFMLKATAGGGGSGNEIIRFASDMDAVIERIGGRSRRLFKNPKLLLERYIENARHIEVQFMRDQQGHFLNLATRECSLQLRYQKIIEVAPAWMLSKEQEEEIARYAKDIAERVNYCGVGTVEFLLTEKGEILFLEVNPRLQVEHGITELITGFDLVEMQILIAQGRDLPVSQEEVHTMGYAIEARVSTLKQNPQDPTVFIPVTGTVDKFHLPKMKDVRIDHALQNGEEIGVNYNPTQLKVMAWGQTRKKAIQKLITALKRIKITGVETNISFLLLILKHPKIKEGEYGIEFLEKLLVESPGTFNEKEKAAAIGVALVTVLKNTPKIVVPSRWRLAGRLDQTMGFSRGKW